jgi:hypothetical protein
MALSRSADQSAGLKRTVVPFLWLIIGSAAVGQRSYFSPTLGLHPERDDSSPGALNYLGLAS